MIASLSVIVTTGKSYAIDSAVKQAHLAGIPVVVAAGNFKRNACLYSPASSPYAISVGESLTEGEGTIILCMRESDHMHTHACILRVFYHDTT